MHTLPIVHTLSLNPYSFSTKRSQCAPRPAAPEREREREREERERERERGAIAARPLSQRSKRQAVASAALPNVCPSCNLSASLNSSPPLLSGVIPATRPVCPPTRAVCSKAYLGVHVASKLAPPSTPPSASPSAPSSARKASAAGSPPQAAGNCPWPLRRDGKRDAATATQPPLYRFVACVGEAAVGEGEVARESWPPAPRLRPPAPRIRPGVACVGHGRGKKWPRKGKAMWRAHGGGGAVETGRLWKGMGPFLMLRMAMRRLLRRSKCDCYA